MLCTKTTKDFDEEKFQELFKRDLREDMIKGFDMILDLSIELDKLHPVAKDSLNKILSN